MTRFTPPNVGTSGEVVLYHIWPSHCSQKVRLCLAEKGVEYVGHVVNIGPPAENYEPWYARLNSNLVVPTLRHGETVVTDSRRIVEYIETHFEGPPLMPADDDARETVSKFMALADALDIRAVSYSKAPKLLTRALIGMRARKLRRLQRKNPDLEEVYARKLEDLSNWRSSATEPEEVAQRQAQIDEALDRVEERLERGLYVADDQYSLADVLWTSVAARLEMLGAADRIEARPHLAGWYARMKARSSFSEADIWTRAKPAALLRIAGPYLLGRLLLATAVIGAGIALVMLA